MSTVTVLRTPNMISAFDMRNSTAAVIDVLRATSSIVHAFSSGCKRVIPAMNRREALMTKERNPEALLCGEQEGVKIPGFELGNSPREYTKNRVGGKTLIITTTNGTRAILGAASRGACPVFLCSFLNVSAVTRAVLDAACPHKKDVCVVCSGSDGGYSFEDFACAGALSYQLGLSGLHLHASALEAVQCFQPYKNDILQVFEDSVHGQYLKDIGFPDDLQFCANLDSETSVPVLSGNGFKLLQHADMG